ncbi:MAG: hypothetical protein IJW64_02490 [Clostridia bacterium]|nr:hypothetical protein [Clostridia bacterium]
MKIDIDALFDKYLDDFIENNLDKYSPNQIEKMVEEIYEEFGTKPNLVLCGLSPIEYFRQKKTQELLEEFENSFTSGSSVCDFLCRELENRKDAEDELISFSKDSSDEIATCAVNILSQMNSEKALKSFLVDIDKGELCESLTESMIEAMVKNADMVKEDLLLIYDVNKPIHKQFLEFFESMSKDDRVYQILFDEYLNRKENRAEVYGYFGKYGDDRILGYLYGEVENNELTAIELEEIKLAIEKLGGDFDRLIVKTSH